MHLIKMTGHLSHRMMMKSFTHTHSLPLSLSFTLCIKHSLSLTQSSLHVSNTHTISFYLSLTCYTEFSTPNPKPPKITSPFLIFSAPFPFTHFFNSSTCNCFLLRVLQLLLLLLSKVLIQLTVLSLLNEMKI